MLIYKWWNHFYWRGDSPILLTVSNAFSFGGEQLSLSFGRLSAFANEASTLFQLVISVWYSLDENYFVRILRRYLFPSSPSIRNPLCGTPYRTKKNCSFHVFLSIFSCFYIVLCSIFLGENIVGIYFLQGVGIFFFFLHFCINKWQPSISVHFPTKCSIEFSKCSQKQCSVFYYSYER